MTTEDFSLAKYTAIVSDLHLCEEEPFNTKYPLWKRYKNREFFFDDQFHEFLVHLDKKTQGQVIELIFNGDIFDFDSVTAKPESPTYRISWFENETGLKPQEDKSVFKIKRILDHHKKWVESVRWFIKKGHRAVFIIGNHDLELHWAEVQETIIESLDLTQEERKRVWFNEWFYISNKDTLIEHGNQYDPYCLAQDPVNPFIQRFNQIEVRVPFGNLATRYLINKMGFFNPHVDSNFIMSAKEYVVFFFKYMLKAQPQLLFTWLFWSTVILLQSFVDRLRPSIKNPLNIEGRIEKIAERANATPRMVRELKELFVAPASSYPLIIARELWLDRAFLVFLVFAFLVEIFLFINNMYKISFFWMLVPVLLFLPFFMFYSKSIRSDVHEYKEPRERILTIASMICKVNRIIYGHTHHIRHELIGPVEHLNSGTWSPAFLDVECEKAIDNKSFIWIEPSDSGSGRQAQVFLFIDGQEQKAFTRHKKVQAQTEIVSGLEIG